MASVSIAPETANTDRIANKTPYALRPFSWLDDKAQSNPGAEFISAACDVSHGMALVLDLVQDSQGLADFADEASPLNHQQRADLLRFVTTSARMLSRMAFDTCDKINILADKSDA